MVKQDFYESKHNLQEFAEFMSAAYLSDKTNINVRLSEALHLAVKQAAPGRTRTVEKAYEEALTDWLNKGADQTGPTDDATARGPERQHVADLLLLLRSGNAAFREQVLGALRTWKIFEGDRLKAEAERQAKAAKAKKTGS